MSSITLKELSSVAEKVLATLTFSEHATVLALKGNLGAGKTTFTKALAASLGVEEVVTSPTFVIEKKYPLKHSHFKKLIHIDAYRLETSAELTSLGWSETMSDPHNLILVEWPERVEGILPRDMITISFEVVDEQTRNISIDYGNKN